MDCLEGLKQLDSDSVHCCITSPPYWALRDYGIPGQIGQEDNPVEYVERLCAVFAEVYRVLRPDGTFWLNISDTYCGTGDKADYFDPKNPKGRTGQKKAKNYQIPGLKRKDLCGIPWRVAFALRNMGWYLRQEIIWHKPNTMPESVTDRCVKAHESVFLFAKSQRYYFDYKAIREPVTQSTVERAKRAVSEKNKYAAGAPGQTAQTLNKSRSRMSDDIPQWRNKRSVWSVSTRPLKDAHFAAFPRALIEPCILAGCPVGGVTLDPFMGSGTVAMTAKALGRQYIGFELNPEYIGICEKRIQEGK
jgi:DNA modification methylase